MAMLDITNNYAKTFLKGLWFVAFPLVHLTHMQFWPRSLILQQVEGSIVTEGHVYHALGLKKEDELMNEDEMETASSTLQRDLALQRKAKARDKDKENKVRWRSVMSGSSHCYVWLITLTPTSLP